MKVKPCGGREAWKESFWRFGTLVSSKNGVVMIIWYNLSEFGLSRSGIVCNAISLVQIELIIELVGPSPLKESSDQYFPLVSREN